MDRHEDLSLREIQDRLDQLAERRLGRMSVEEQLEYIELLHLEAAAIAARDAEA